MRAFPAAIELLLLHSINSDCLLIQETTLSAIRRTRPDERKPQVYHPDPLIPVCQDFEEKPVCCSPAAR